MTGPEDSHTGTRPISVAELLAKNGTIGAPPVGGRRRRRRGNADAVTVAELTGEIPVISDDMPPPGTIAEPAVELSERVAPVERAAKPTKPVESRPVVEEVEEDEVPAATNGARTHEVEDDYRDHLKARAADPEPVAFKPRRTYPTRDYRPSGTGAERMSPDFVDDVDDDATPDDGRTDDASLTGYVGALFGGQGDDVARRAGQSARADTDEHDVEPDSTDEFDDVHAAADTDDTHDTDDAYGEHHTGEPRSSLAHGAWVVGQCVIAVAFGAGLFLAFDQLWKWSTIVALVLGVLVILGLAGGVRIVRKTEDIGSTLTAVAVGAMVTFGPLALQAG